VINLEKRRREPKKLEQRTSVDIVDWLLAIDFSLA
jgi:hypothetical protein